MTNLMNMSMNQMYPPLYEPNMNFYMPQYPVQPMQTMSNSWVQPQLQSQTQAQKPPQTQHVKNTHINVASEGDNSFDRCSHSETKATRKSEPSKPAGRPSYQTYANSEEENETKQRSASRWRADESLYEPKKAKYKINRQNTNEVEYNNKYSIAGMIYPKWWGDTSEEKARAKKSMSKSMIEERTPSNRQQVAENKK